MTDASPGYILPHIDDLAKRSVEVVFWGAHLKNDKINKTIKKNNKKTCGDVRSPSISSSKNLASFSHLRNSSLVVKLGALTESRPMTPPPTMPLSSPKPSSLVARPIRCILGKVLSRFLLNWRILLATSLEATAYSGNERIWGSGCYSEPMTFS